MRDFLRGLDTGALGEIGLVAFVVAFALVLVYTFTLSKRDRQALKQLPLDDAPPAPGSAPDGPTLR